MQSISSMLAKPSNYSWVAAYKGIIKLWLFSSLNIARIQLKLVQYTRQQYRRKVFVNFKRTISSQDDWPNEEWKGNQIILQWNYLLCIVSDCMGSSCVQVTHSPYSAFYDATSSLYLWWLNVDSVAVRFHSHIWIVQLLTRFTVQAITYFA